MLIVGEVHTEPTTALLVSIEDLGGTESVVVSTWHQVGEEKVVPGTEQISLPAHLVGQLVDCLNTAKLAVEEVADGS